MKQFYSFTKKEFLHIVRDPLTLSIMLILPVVLVLILGFAISTEIKNIPFVVVDNSKTIESQQIIQKMSENKYFSFVQMLSSTQELDEIFKHDICKVAIVFSNSHNESHIQIIIDNSNPNEAATMYSYVQQILAQYKNNKGVYSEFAIIAPEIKLLYNPHMKASYGLVPGIIGMVMMLVCAAMTSVSIAREKELGTLELIIVSPARPIQIVLAKAVPYLCIALFDVIICLILSYFVLQVPICGSIWLIMLLSSIYTLSAIALGLLISNFSRTQQEAMVTAELGLMLPSMLLSNLIFPIESMPTLLQFFSYIVPARWFITPLRSIMLKGVGLADIWVECVVLLSMSIILLLVSIVKFNKRV